MARRATLIGQVRAENDRILVLDAGNALVGDREPAITSRGRSSIAAMDTLGYDAMALGLQDLTLLSLHDVEMAMVEAHFAVLSANAVVSATGALLADPYVILERGGMSIGILGLTEPGEAAEVRVEDPREAARRYLPEVAERADVVVLLSHAGLDVDRAIAEEFPAVDLVVSGAGPALGPAGMAGNALHLTPDVPSPGYDGARVGVAELTFSRRGALVDHTWRKAVLGPEIAEDPDVAGWVAGAFQEYLYGTP